MIAGLPRRSTQAPNDRPLSEALDLAANGLLIFPASVTFVNGQWHKKPLIVRWQSLASSDPDRLRYWWQQFPTAVPAIKLDGLVVLDADRHSVDGVAALEALGPLPEHPVTLTAGNGEHHIFQQPPEALGQRRGALPAGIDVRGVGGWIVGPGAVRPDGKMWRAKPGTPPLNEAPVLPDWIAELIRLPRVAHETHHEKTNNKNPPLYGPLVAITELHKPLYLRIVRCKPPNGHEQRRVVGILKDLIACRSLRNDRLNWAAYELCAFEWLPSDVLIELLEAACELNGYTAKDGIEAARATIRSGLEAGRERFDRKERS